MLYFGEVGYFWLVSPKEHKPLLQTRILIVIYHTWQNWSGPVMVHSTSTVQMWFTSVCQVADDILKPHSPV